MKNPYELRYEIYQEAQGRLTEKFHCDHSVWMDWNRQDSEFTGKCPVSNRPAFPTHEEILTEANKIYTFVQTQ
tara:strand:+ start:93 stop:311 length:219 start_codon:yes stop_codon:yes gene_type:complete